MDPATTAILDKLGTEFAGEFGSSFGNAIGRAIFGEADRNKTLREVLTNLEEMGKKLDILVVESREILEIVRNFDDTLDRTRLDDAYTLIHSDMDLFKEESDWPTLKFIPLRDLWRSLKLIADSETDVDLLVTFPRYAEYLFVRSGGRFSALVESGLDTVLGRMGALKNAQVSAINEDFKDARNQFREEYYNNGRLMDRPPWIDWSLKPPRNKTIREEGCDYDERTSHCSSHDKVVPDHSWNSLRIISQERLVGRRSTVTERVIKVRSFIYCEKVIEQYFESFKKRAKYDQSGIELEKI